MINNEALIASPMYIIGNLVESAKKDVNFPELKAS